VLKIEVGLGLFQRKPRKRFNPPRILHNSSFPRPSTAICLQKCNYAKQYPNYFRQELYNLSSHFSGFLFSYVADPLTAIVTEFVTPPPLSQRLWSILFLRKHIFASFYDRLTESRFELTMLTFDHSIRSVNTDGLLSILLVVCYFMARRNLFFPRLAVVADALAGLSTNRMR
jgi:hypothetical protein